MSLERAYKNCRECYEFHSGSEQVIKDKSIARILNGVNTNEVILGINSLFIAIYLRNEAMKALEERRDFYNADQYVVAEHALEQCKSCDYNSPAIKNFIDKSAKE